NAKLKPYLIQAVSHTGTLVAASAPDRLSVLEKTPESARGENQHVPPGRAAHRRTHALLRVSFVNRRRPERCALSADRPGRPHERSRAWRDVRLGDQQEGRHRRADVQRSIASARLSLAEGPHDRSRRP